MGSTIGAVSTGLVGTRLGGRYRLDAQIGTGGMSTVYRAFDTVLEREVAIKLMHREIARDSDQLERFRREARAVAQLNHPHIVQVIDFGEDEHLPFIVFEFVDGETLKERIRRFGRLAVPEAIAYAIEIARALGAAHERGIVHRDVKPQNVLVDEEGSAKVTDFGIARTLDQEGLTADGRVLGTTDYVSPEQALGHPVTGQSDIYSLGVVLFEMLTGDVPFHAESQVAVAMKHVREELPDLAIRRPEVSAALAAVLDRATAKRVELRYTTVEELIADLEEVLFVETARAGQATGEATAVLRTLPAPKRERLPLRTRRSVGALVGLLVAATLAIAAILVFTASETAQRGTGQRGEERVPATPDVRVLSLGQRAATDFDPDGGDGEHPEEADLVLDGDRGTTWSTERYEGGQLGKPGVGVHVESAVPVRATRMTVDTETPGFTASVYAVEDGPPETLGGWTRVAEPRRVGESSRITLDTGGRRFRYYLLWITRLPDGEQSAEIGEIRLAAQQG